MRSEQMHEIFDCVPEIFYETGNRYFLGNLENYRHALLAVLKSTKAKLPILNAMIESDEYEGLRMISQTLNKMMSNIGAINISELSYELECMLLNSDKETLIIGIREYIKCLSTFTEHLEHLLKKLEVKHVLQNEEKISLFRQFDFTKTQDSIKASGDLLQRKII